jgi:hypothetical protein
MQVWVYPEKVYQQLGDVRFEVEAYVVPQGWDTWTEDQRENFDPASHLCLHRYAATETEARKIARQMLKRDDLSFGSVIIQKQVVDWYVEEDRIAEWSDAGEPEYLP